MGGRDMDRWSLRRGLGRLIRKTAFLSTLVLVFSWPLFGLYLGCFLPLAVTPLMVQRSFLEGENRWQEWLARDKLPDDLRRAAIVSEDARFCVHRGFDWTEIGNAWNEYRDGRRLRGASTISMQTARTAFLWGGRDPVRKGLEIWYTVWMEMFWSKDRIIDVYLNTVEWGPGIYGAEAASQYYFGTSASSLGRAEAARLVAILPNPRRWDARAANETVRARSASILARMDSAPVRGNRACP